LSCPAVISGHEIDEQPVISIEIMAEKQYRYGDYGRESSNEYGMTSDRVAANTSSGRPGGYDDRDVFGHEEGHDVRFHHSP
jgi:hypothetical protein